MSLINIYIPNIRSRGFELEENTSDAHAEIHSFVQMAFRRYLGLLVSLLYF